MNGHSQHYISVFKDLIQNMLYIFVVEILNLTMTLVHICVISRRPLYGFMHLHEDLLLRMVLSLKL